MFNLKSRKKAQHGQAFVEYAIVTAAISVGMVLALDMTGEAIRDTFQKAMPNAADGLNFEELGTDEPELDEIAEDTSGDDEAEDTSGDDEAEDTSGGDEGEDTSGDDEGEDTSGDDEGEDTSGDDEGEDTSGDDEEEDTSGDDEEEDTSGDDEEEDTSGGDDNDGLVLPIFECVEQVGKKDFLVHYGYHNLGTSVVEVSIGKDNKFTGAANDQGQPETFQPGLHQNVFTVEWNGKSELAWRLLWQEEGHDDAQEATADKTIVCP